MASYIFLKVFDPPVPLSEIYSDLPLQRIYLLKYRDIKRILCELLHLFYVFHAFLTIFECDPLAHLLLHPTYLFIVPSLFLDTLVHVSPLLADHHLRQLPHITHLFQLLCLALHLFLHYFLHGFLDFIYESPVLLGFHLGRLEFPHIQFEVT